MPDPRKPLRPLTPPVRGLTYRRKGPAVKYGDPPNTLDLGGLLDMTKSPDLRTALACAQQVIASNTSYTDAQTVPCRLLITEMYDLDYAGIPEIIEKVLNDNLDPDKAVKAVNALKAMYNSTGNG